MTKEELFNLLKQTKKDYEVVITWILKDATCISKSCIGDVKVNLSCKQIELSLYDC